MKSTKEFLLWLALSTAILLLCVLVFSNILSITSFGVVYIIFMFLPGYVWVYPLHQSFLKTFLLSNFVGFAIWAVCVPLDVVFKIPLTTTTFASVMLLTVAIGIFVWRKEYLGKKEPTTDVGVN